MADKEKQQWGSLIHEKLGIAIRWSDYILTPEGKRKRKVRYEFLGRVSEAKARKEILKRLGTRANPQMVAPLFKDHCERWVRDILPDYKFSGRAVRPLIINKHLIPRFGDWRVSEISELAVQAFVADLRERNYSAHSIHDYHEVLRAVLREAVVWYGLPKNPAVGIRLPKLKPKREQFALSAEQAGKLIGNLSTKYRAMVGLAIVSGMRRGELLALRWSHVSDKEIQISQAFYQGHLDTPKTEAGIRNVPLDRWVGGLLVDWRRESKKTATTDLVFGTRTGNAENPNNILRRQIFPACDAVGIPRSTWLTFRRTFSTLAHHSGVSAKTIAELMGHANVDTQFVYIQSIDEAKRVATGGIADELSRYCPDREQGQLQFVN